MSHTICIDAKAVRSQGDDVRAIAEDLTANARALRTVEVTGDGFATITAAASLAAVLAARISDVAEATATTGQKMIDTARIVSDGEQHARRLIATTLGQVGQ